MLFATTFQLLLTDGLYPASRLKKELGVQNISFFILGYYSFFLKYFLKFYFIIIIFHLLFFLILIYAQMFTSLEGMLVLNHALVYSVGICSSSLASTSPHPRRGCGNLLIYNH